MALYMYEVAYTPESVAAQIKEPHDRLEAVKPALEAMGVKIVVGGYPLGEYDVLIIVEAADEKLTLAARNLPHVELLAAAAINPVSLARHDKVLATVGAVKLLEERLQ